MNPWKVRILALFALLGVQACADRQPQTSSETHFQMCATTTDCAPSEACIAQLCHPVEIVSSDETAAHAGGLSVQVNGQDLSLKVDAGAHLRYDMCDLFEGMDKQIGAKWAPLRNDLPGTYYQPSTFDGYMLDDKFVPPSTSAGCDLVGCDDLPDGAVAGVAVEYVATGTTMPPADYVYMDPFVRPSSIQTYQSQPLHGARIRSYVKYFTDMQCLDRHDVALEITLP